MKTIASGAGVSVSTVSLASRLARALLAAPHNADTGFRRQAEIFAELRRRRHVGKVRSALAPGAACVYHRAPSVEKAARRGGANPFPQHKRQFRKTEIFL
jgi:hypothetical protein